MTDREKLNKAYGILYGATDGASHIMDGSITRVLISIHVIEQLLTLLDNTGTNNVVTTTKGTT